jgi:hypothetical protein
MDYPIVELALWGVVHQFSDGYRAQYAKIVKIFLPQLGETVELAARAESLELTYMVPIDIVEIPTREDSSNTAYVPRTPPLKIADFEMFVNSDEEHIRAFCRRELKKRYLQKIASLKKRIQYANTIIDQASADLEIFEKKRALLKG